MNTIPRNQDIRENHDRSLASVIAEIKDELKEFAGTRFTMLKTEISEDAKRLKVALPLAAVAVIFLLTAYLLITLALVCLVAALLHHTDFHWVFAFVIMGVLWGILGGTCAFLAKRELELRRILPGKTIGVLKGDKVWLEKEARNEI